MRPSETRGVRHEVAHRNASRAMTVEFRDVANDGRIQFDVAALDEEHEGRRSRNNFRERCEIPERVVDAHRRTLRPPPEMTVRLREYDPIVSANHECGTGAHPFPDAPDDA